MSPRTTSLSSANNGSPIWISETLTKDRERADSDDDHDACVERLLAMAVPDCPRDAYRHKCARTDRNLVAHVVARLADYKKPRGIVFVPEVRRSPAGKADLLWARAVAEAAAGQQTR